MLKSEIKTVAKMIFPEATDDELKTVVETLYSMEDGINVFKKYYPEVFFKALLPRMKDFMLDFVFYVMFGSLPEPKISKTLLNREDKNNV